MNDPICPFLNGPCIEHACMLYTHVTMVSNPQTGASQDTWGCAVAWLPILLIENSSKTRQVAASVDSMRNEVVKRQDELNSAVAERRNEVPHVVYGPIDAPGIAGPSVER